MVTINTQTLTFIAHEFISNARRVKNVPGFDTTETMMLSNSELCLCILHIYDVGMGGVIYVTSVFAEHFPPVRLVVTLEC